ncbi:MAG: arginine deiminase family protein [Anaerolineae bacterium]
MWGAQTEYGPLKKVLMHRPGEEMEVLAPHNLEAFHFSRMVDLTIFQREFDNLATALEESGVEVILLTDLLQDEPQALHYIARRPNMTYTRDLAVVTKGGAILMSMCQKGRKGDEWVIGRAMQKLGIPILGRIEPPGILEGGGIEFLSERTAIVALCDRANEVAIRQLCDLLLGEYLDEIVMVPTPEGEIHIDGILMIVDRDLAVAYRPSLEFYPSTLFRAGRSPQYIWLPDFLEERGVELVETTHRERDMEFINYITVAPRQVIGYEWAIRTSQEIERRGGKATGIPGGELVKGNAGPHCMTCPLLRE